MRVTCSKDSELAKALHAIPEGMLEAHGASHLWDVISERLGEVVEGRHTSLGDARTTAEILVRLLPMLTERGVVTLADAKAFCDKMLLLRWQSSRY